jgi:NAD(P)-dependent dehydrogenase (short-subunit alcohol dehydrogenase family)
VDFVGNRLDQCAEEGRGGDPVGFASSLTNARAMAESPPGKSGHCGDAPCVPAWRPTELASEVTAEMGRAFVTHRIGDFRYAPSRFGQQGAGRNQSQVLLVLQWCRASHGLEMLVKRRRTHACGHCKVGQSQRCAEVAAEPQDRLCNPACVAVHDKKTAQHPSGGGEEQTVVNLAQDRGPEDLRVKWVSHQIEIALQRTDQRWLRLSDRQRAAIGVARGDISQLFVKPAHYREIDFQYHRQIGLLRAGLGDPGKHRQVVTDQKGLARAKVGKLLADVGFLAPLQDQADYGLIDHRLNVADLLFTQDDQTRKRLAILMKLIAVAVALLNEARKVHGSLPCGTSYQAFRALALVPASIRRNWQELRKLWQAGMGIRRYFGSTRLIKQRKAPMSSIQTQFLDLATHHAVHDAIDPKGALARSATGKVVFIAGASRGIGQATAVAFAEAGAQAVYLAARSEAALEETRALVLAANSETLCALRACDVTVAADVEAAVADCLAQFGALDVADANAGYLGPWTKIGASDPAGWWWNWEVNVKGVYHVIRYTLPALIDSARRHAADGRSGGHLILLSSIGAQLLMPGASDYQTSKHAINRLCEFVQVDHGDDGIKCFALHPGGVSTELGRNMPEAMHAYLVDDPALAAGFAVWLSSGKADWAKGRYLSATWDVEELTALRDRILEQDLLVNRLRTRA